MSLTLELVVAVVLSTVAVFVELPTRKIPNWLCYPSIIFGLILAATQQRLTNHLVGFLCVGLLTIVCFSRQLMAGGTAKLLMATAAVGGLALRMMAFLVVFVVILTVLAVSNWTDPPVPNVSDHAPAQYQWKFATSPLILACTIAHTVIWSWNHRLD